MTLPIRLENGNLLVPMRAEADDGTTGDAAVEIGPEHPDYGRWLAELEGYDPIDKFSGRHEDMVRAIKRSRDEEGR